MRWLVIELGDGKIAIGHGKVNEKIPCITFQLMEEAKEIGSNVADTAKIANAEQICISFGNVESLNVLQTQLSLLKDKYFTKRPKL
jgi:hypothetical protein